MHQFVSVGGYKLNEYQKHSINKQGPRGYFESGGADK